MKFHTLENVPIHPNDAVFRQSSLMLFIPTLIMLGIAGGAWYAAIHTHSWVVGGVALLFSLFPLAFGSMFRHTLHPQNWLLRVHPGGLLIKFRSYLNEHFPADRPVVVELAPDEIEWAGITREGRFMPQSHHGTTKEYITALDLKLRDGNLAALETLLREERQLKTSSRWNHEPIRLMGDGVIRVHLRSREAAITPGAKKALAALTGLLRVTARPEQKIFTDLVSDPGDTRAREDKILELVEGGNTIAAVQLTRNFYRISLSEAHKFVDELSGRK